jgi:uncharacterized protein (DUF2249 family)
MLQLDVRSIIPKEKHPRIMAEFGNLAIGESLELINDHNPIPLYHYFNAEMPEQFLWEYLEDGPEIWRVKISRK